MMARTRWMFLWIPLLISFLVYFYNIIRFPIFNNDFDPWFHFTSIEQMMASNELELNTYMGFPGLHVLVIYIAITFNVNPFLVLKWFPLFTGVLSSLVAVVFTQNIIKHHLPKGKDDPISDDVCGKVVAFGCILNNTVSVFSLVSSGMFWGQMLTAALVPVILIKFVEINQHNENRLILEFILATTTLFLIHHLTSFLIVVFLSFTQLYLLFNAKATIKGTLVTFIAVLIFLLRYEALSLNLSIVTALTWGKTNFFYLYFIMLVVVFAGAFILRKLKPLIAHRLPRAQKLVPLKRLGSNLVLMALAGVLLAIAFLAYIYPYILSFFKGLSPSWFLYYGSNLILLAPLAIVGVIMFGRVLNKTIMKTVVYSWVMTIVFVLILLFAMYFLHLGVGALEFGRLSTFIYPMLSIFAAFAILVLHEKQGRKQGNATLSKTKKVIQHIKPITRVVILAGFCILMPVAVIGITPPPSATLTRYWNIPSEQTTAEWLAGRAENNTSWINVDYHMLEMSLYYCSKEDKDLHPGSNYFLSLLDNPQNQAKLEPRRNYLILLDDVMLDTSLSYSDANAEHGVLPPLGRDHLAIYDTLPFLNLVYCTDSQWLYQCYIE